MEGEGQWFEERFSSHFLWEEEAQVKKVGVDDQP